MDALPTPAPEFASEREFLELSEGAYRLLAAARALIESHRTIDLAGVQDQIGLICARALDLSPAHSGLARTALLRIVSGLDALEATMTETTA